MMETTINIAKSTDLEGRRQVCIQVISSSWNTKKNKRFDCGFLRNLKRKISLEISTLMENRCQICVQQAHCIHMS